MPAFLHYLYGDQPIDFPSLLPFHWLKWLHYPKLAGNSSMGKKDVREGKRRGFFAAASKAAWAQRFCFQPASAFFQLLSESW